MFNEYFNLPLFLPAASWVPGSFLGPASLALCIIEHHALPATKLEYRTENKIIHKKLHCIPFFQLWDVRDGQCKQTFTGHESDINAVTVRNPLFFYNFLKTVSTYSLGTV
jgi:hypothetical protein